MQSFGNGTNSGDVIGLGTGETMKTERQKSSFFDGICGSGLATMKLEKGIASKGKAGGDPDSIKK
jgi:hypothetical protein